MRYECKIINEDHGAYHQIHGRHLDAAPPELDPDPSKLVRTLAVGVQNAHLLKQ